MSESWGAIRQWLLNEAASANTLRELTEALIERLCAIQMPISRLNIGVFTIHPETAGYVYTWRVGSGDQAAELVELPVSHEVTRTEAYLNSPIRVLAEQTTTLRFNLEDPDSGVEFSVLDEFRQAKQTDYCGFSLPHGAGGVGVLTVCTQRPGGFSDLEIAGLASLLPTLKLLIGALESHRLAQTVMRTYLGRRTGDLVLNGKIRRGEGELIDAALWLCDLRGFTAMSEDLGPETTIAVMNAYFDCMASAVWTAGGEILKFMGDAMLVVFRLDDTTDESAASRQAFQAAKDALAELEGLSCEAIAGKPMKLRAGIALHMGEVVYGNIGARTRLDFTIMGPAVNLLARLQTLSGERDAPIVMSAEFASLLNENVESMGHHTFKGVN